MTGHILSNRPLMAALSWQVLDVHCMGMGTIAGW